MTGDELIAHLQSLPAEVRALRVASYIGSDGESELVLYEKDFVQELESKYITIHDPIYWNKWVDLNPPEKFLVI